MATYLELNKDLTEEEKTIKKEIHRFAEEIVRPASIELDKMPDPEDVIAEGSPLRDVFKQAYQLEYHTSTMPDSLGGAGMSPLARHIYTEEMGWGSADFAVGLGVTSMPFGFAAMTGNQDIIREQIMPFVQDREGKYIGCWAITEPQHGSDTLMVESEAFRDPSIGADLRAKSDGDDWLISGQKSAWVSNGTIATHACAFVSIDQSQGRAGGGVALIPLTGEGVTKGKPLNKLGQRALNQGEIFFDDVRIPKSYMVVDTPAYAYVLNSVLAGANAFMGATFTGLARAAFEEALTYSKERVQGGKPISRHQNIQLKLANMFINVEASRQLSRAAMIYNATTTPPASQYSMASKIFCTQAAFEVASEALQVFGGYGLSKEFIVEKLFRDARAAMIEDGTNEILSLTAAQKVLNEY